jgi:hypothetical protein
MNYQITVRYGKKAQRYHSLTLEASDAVSALRASADQIPAEIASEVNLVELREAPDFDKTMAQEEEG